VRDELRAAAAAASSAEQRRRLESLLSQKSHLVSNPDELRSLRAVEVLEHVGSEEARRVLQELTKGAAAARLTRDSRAALQRLMDRR